MFPHQGKNSPKKDEYGRYDREELLFYYLALSHEERPMEFLTVKDTAVLVDKTEKTVINWINKDKIAGVMIGERAWYVYKTSLIEYLRKIQEEN